MSKDLIYKNDKKDLEDYLSTLFYDAGNVNTAKLTI